MMSVEEWLRRAVVRFLGEGPRCLAKGEAATLGVEILSSSESGVFENAPAVNEVTPDLPVSVSAWPSVPLREPPLQVWRMRGAGIYGGDGVIYDRRTRRALRETTNYWFVDPEDHPVFKLPRAKPVQHFSGRSIFLGGLGGQTFYHFLIEGLPKLGALAEWGKNADRIIVPRYIESTKEAWLRHAGCRLPIVWLDSLSHFIFDELVFCMPVVADCKPGPGLLGKLRKVVGTQHPDSDVVRKRCVWASRVGPHARSVEWEQDLISALPPSWEVVDFGALKPWEAIDLGAQVRAFAGLHGAAFSNLGLWNPGVKVLEIYTRPNLTWYPSISLAAGHQHYVQFADDKGAVPRLIKTLEEFGAPEVAC
jgi:capsular polysaccharide biosynthesis protein